MIRVFYLASAVILLSISLHAQLPFCNTQCSP